MSKISIIVAVTVVFYVYFLWQFFELLIRREKTEIGITNFEKLECSGMFDGNENALAKGTMFSLNESVIISRLISAKDKCTEFQSIFQLFRFPLSDEEADFGLANGMLVHDNFVQISFLLSAIYQPQNQFCIAIDVNAERLYKSRSKLSGQVYNVSSYYVSRYQQHSNRPPSKCFGYYYRYSCVFGVHDLPRLISRHELIAHKLYFSFQPAAFLCLIQRSRQTAIKPNGNFSAIEYQLQNIPDAPKFIHYH